MPNSPCKPDTTASLLASLRSANGADLLRWERDLASTSPAMFAVLTSQGKWKLARHLACLDRAIVESIDGAIARTCDGLVVSMPPQHGKSELCSKYLPAWYLATFPDRRVILTSYEADFAAS